MSFRTWGKVEDEIRHWLLVVAQVFEQFLDLILLPIMSQQRFGRVRRYHRLVELAALIGQLASGQVGARISKMSKGKLYRIFSQIPRSISVPTTQ